MIPVEATVLVTVSLFWWGLDSFRPLDAWVVLDMQEHLLYGCTEGGIVLEPAWGEVELGTDLAIVVAFSWPTTPFFLCGMLLLSFPFVWLWIRPSVLLPSSAEGVLNVHVLLCFHHEVDHAGQGIFFREKRNLEGSSPTMRAVTITFSYASSTYNISLLNCDI